MSDRMSDKAVTGFVPATTAAGWSGSSNTTVDEEEDAAAAPDDAIGDADCIGALRKMSAGEFVSSAVDDGSTWTRRAKADTMNATKITTAVRLMFFRLKKLTSSAGTSASTAVCGMSRLSESTFWYVDIVVGQYSARGSSILADDGRLAAASKTERRVESYLIYCSRRAECERFAHVSRRRSTASTPSRYLGGRDVPRGRVPIRTGAHRLIV